MEYLSIGLGFTELGFTEDWPEKKKPTRLVLAKRHVGDWWETGGRLVGDSPNIWKKVLWSDETKM
jgi:hypothetical protein